MIYSTNLFNFGMQSGQAVFKFGIDHFGLCVQLVSIFGEEIDPSLILGIHGLVDALINSRHHDYKQFINTNQFCNQYKQFQLHY